MVRVRITEAVLVRGQHCAVGDEIDVPDVFAAYLVRIQRAVIVAAPTMAEAAETAVDPAVNAGEKAVSVRRTKNAGAN